MVLAEATRKLRCKESHETPPTGRLSLECETPICWSRKNTRTAPEIVMLALSGDFLPLPGVSLWPSTLFWEATLDEIVEALPLQDVLTLLLKGARAA